jgi:hypothetical protein
MQPFMTLKFKTIKMKHISIELIIWITALILLGTAGPQVYNEGHHFTLCPLAHLGISWCPGCGLGRAIILLFHGNLQGSFHQHWFGIPAVLIIGYRIIILGRNQIIMDLLLEEKEK